MRAVLLIFNLYRQKMDKSYKIAELITDNSDEQYPNKVISLQVMLTVSSNTNTLTGIQNIEINFDDNIHFVPFESLTEEIVNSWLDLSLINSKLDLMEESFNSSVAAQYIERMPPPWIKPQIILSNQAEIQQELDQINAERPRFPTFEEAVSEIVLKVLREKSLISS
jgi:hypothetical protein